MALDAIATPITVAANRLLCARSLYPQKHIK